MLLVRGKQSQRVCVCVRRGGGGHYAPLNMIWACFSMCIWPADMLRHRSQVPGHTLTLGIVLHV